MLKLNYKFSFNVTLRLYLHHNVKLNYCTHYQ